MEPSFPQAKYPVFCLARMTFFTILRLNTGYLQRPRWAALKRRIRSEITPDGTIISAGKVPSFLPGKNDILHDFATEYGVPPEAALGGAETTYPEYIKKMKTMKVAPRTTTEHYKRFQ